MLSYAYDYSTGKAKAEEDHKFKLRSSKNYVILNWVLKEAMGMS